MAFGIRNASRKLYRLAARPLVYALILSLALPLPMAGSVFARSNDDPGTAHVTRRLNSPERARAIEEAARQDAAARAAFAQSEAAAPAQAAPAAQAGGVAPATPAASSAPRAEKAAQATASGPGKTASAASRPKTVTEVLFNGVTGFMGLPGLTSSGRYDPYDPNADQGLGFHQDGTARRADGTTGANSASARYDGRRAAAYMGNGLGYGPGGYGSGYGGTGDMTGWYGAGYDPVTGHNYRLGDPDKGGRRADGGTFGGSGMFDNPQQYFMQRGLNYGLGFLNSAGEAALSGLVDGGRARLNFMIDLDGRINGEGDVLLPFYDSQYTTIYTQLGARSMSGMNSGGSDGQGADRWIGNAGLGQRWFPQAASLEDSGKWMLGYNAFFDYDFTRSHQRGGIGVEAQYDWLHLASNYYFPISSWRDSKDFDGDFVKERAAEGWDVRLKGYMPFYRNLAVTGAYTQWYGDHVGMFSSSKLEKDPRVWSYGLEYTPVPLVSGFVNQRSTEKGRSDTEFGLRLTYHFNMPWEEQISHAKVAELRTVSGSRHEFVDRENRIILEYKAKNSYRIEYLGPDGNGFRFRVVDGFGKYMAGQTVRVTTSGAYLAEAASAEPQTLFARAVNFLDELISVKAAYAAGFASKTYVTDGQGYFWVQLDASAPNPTQVTVQAGDNSQTFTLGGATLGAGLSASAPTVLNSGTVTLTFDGKAASASMPVTWTLVSGPGALSAQQPSADGTGKATATLTANATGSGPIVVKATVNGVDYTCTVTIGDSYSFGTITTSGGTGSFTASTTATFTAPVLKDGLAYTGPAVAVTWSIVSADNSANEAVTTANQNAATGLAWGGTATTNPGTALTGTDTSNTDGSGNASIQLTDIMGERTVTVRASVTVGGNTYTADQAITFGAGPLSAFKLPSGGAVGQTVWANAFPISGATAFPAAALCGGSGNTTWTGGNYSSTTKLPTITQLQAVSTSGSGNSAWQAAGWPSGDYWTGELFDIDRALAVYVSSGFNGSYLLNNSFRMVCGR